MSLPSILVIWLTEMTVSTRRTQGFESCMTFCSLTLRSDRHTYLPRILRPTTSSASSPSPRHERQNAQQQEQRGADVVGDAHRAQPLATITTDRAPPSAVPLTSFAYGHAASAPGRS